MKKCFFTVLTAVLILTTSLFAACAKQPKNANVQEVYDKLIAAGNFSKLTKVPEKQLNEIYGIDTAKLKQYVFCTSENSSINTDEIAIFEVSDTAYAETLVKRCVSRLNSQRKTAASYALPDEFEKLKPVEVVRVGNFVYYAVGKNYDGIMKIFRANIG